MTSSHLALGTGSSTKLSNQKLNLADEPGTAPRPFTAAGPDVPVKDEPLKGPDPPVCSTGRRLPHARHFTVKRTVRSSLRATYADETTLSIDDPPQHGEQKAVARTVSSSRMTGERLAERTDQDMNDARPVNMRPFGGSSNPCFAGSSPVMLPSGRCVPVRWLRRGAVVLTPRGPRRVAAVLVTPVRREVMCRVHGVVITPWHPVRRPVLGRGGSDSKYKYTKNRSNNSNNNSKISARRTLPSRSRWAFPAQVAGSGVRYTGCIYSVLLEQDRDPAAHAILVGGVWAVTLGHGIVAGRDVRAHRFFGHYGAVVAELQRLGVRRGGVVVGDGTRRDPSTGLACGFRRWDGRVPAKAAEIRNSRQQSW